MFTPKEQGQCVPGTQNKAEIPINTRVIKGFQVRMDRKWMKIDETCWPKHVNFGHISSNRNGQKKCHLQENRHVSHFISLFARLSEWDWTQSKFFGLVKKQTLKTVWLYWIKAPLWTWFYSKKQRSTESAASRTIHTQLYHPYISPKPSPPHQQHLLFQKSLGAHATPGFFPPKKCKKIPQYLGLILSWEGGQPRYTTLITPKFKIDTTKNNSSKLPLVLV